MHSHGTHTLTLKAGPWQGAAAETLKAEEAAKAEVEETGSKLKDTVNDAVDRVFDTFSFLEPARPVVRALLWLRLHPHLPQPSRIPQWRHACCDALNAAGSQAPA